MLKTSNEYIEVNKHAWDLRTGVHINSEFYDLQAFRQGALSLRPPELEIAGEVQGLRLLHLQCHFGLDTLSWARLGAIATGVDFSTVAIETARRLSQETGVPASFIQADVQALNGALARSYDIAIATYGVLCWLRDLRSWADGIVGSLRPLGRFILVEYHPALDLIFDGKISGCSYYFSSRLKEDQPGRTTGTYTNPEAPISYSEYRFQHTLSDVISALLDAGMRVTSFKEYPYCSYKLLPLLDTCREGVWFPTDREGEIPFMYSIVAEAPDN